MSRNRQTRPHDPLSPRRVYLALAVTVTVLIAAVLHIAHIGRATTARHVPLEGLGHIELALTSAHLWLEELLSGDTSKSFEDVQGYLTLAAWETQNLLAVEEASANDVLPSRHGNSRDQLKLLHKRIADFQALTLERWRQRESGMVGSAADEQYDESFQQLIALATEMKTAARQLIRREQQVLDLLQLLLIVGAVVLAGFVAFTFRRYMLRRRDVEAALRESEEKFRKLYESSNDAVMMLDAKRFLDCNEATLRVFRVKSKEEFCQLHPADLSPPIQPDGIDSMVSANRHIAAAMQDGVDRFEWQHIRADGIEFPAEVLLSALHLEGEPLLQAVVRDVTERKEAEEDRRANEEKLQMIMEAALDAVIMIDTKGKAVHWNPAAHRMFGYTADEVLGREIHALLTPDRFRGDARHALGSFFVSGKGRAVGRILELQAVRKNGEEFPIEISVSPIRTDGAWSAVAVVRDITERKQAEKSLRAEQRALRRLLKSHDQERKLIAYEIHDGLAQQLVAAIMQCEAAGRAARKISDQSDDLFKSLLQMLRQCLAETRRLISGVRPPILDEFGVVTAIQGLIEETQRHGGPRIEFHHNVAFQRLEPVLENTIYRIVQEGLRNACRHSRSQKVMIELTQQPATVRIRIQDWGIGFELDKVDQRRYGLAGIRERTRLLGGHVEVQSAAGEGTTITVTLPENVGDLAETE